MKSKLRQSLEAADESATLYLTGKLAASDAFALSRQCSELPARVKTLRLDLHGVADVGDDAMNAIRGVLRFWRESRGGSFRLSLASQYMIATYAEGTFRERRPSPRTAEPSIADASPAHTAMYL